MLRILAIVSCLLILSNCELLYMAAIEVKSIDLSAQSVQDAKKLSYATTVKGDIIDSENSGFTLRDDSGEMKVVYDKSRFDADLERWIIKNRTVRVTGVYNPDMQSFNASEIGFPPGGPIFYLGVVYSAIKLIIPA